MQDFPETRYSLLLRVQGNDRTAWREFSEIYRPMIYRLARRRGWQDADAQDVAQAVLTKISKSIPRYDANPDRARFRTWLITICNNTLIDELRKRRAQAASHSLDTNEPMAEAEVSEQEITLETRRQIFRWAARHANRAFSATTWKAFWMTTIEAQSVRSVSSQLGISVGAVYTARSRVMQFLKQKVQEYDDADM